MPLKKNSPGCGCCSVPCMDWSDDAPEEIQLTLPAGCERAGTYVLPRDDSESFSLNCPNTTISTIGPGCAVYVLFIGSGDARDSIWVTVGRGTTTETIVRAGVCNDGGSSSGTDAGTVWEVLQELSAWADLDGISVPFTTRETDTEGLSDCSTNDPALVAFVP